jgi:hypothetical protein
MLNWVKFRGIWRAVGEPVSYFLVSQALRLYANQHHRAPSRFCRIGAERIPRQEIPACNRCSHAAISVCRELHQPRKPQHKHKCKCTPVIPLLGKSAEQVWDTSNTGYQKSGQSGPRPEISPESARHPATGCWSRRVIPGIFFQSSWAEGSDFGCL